MTNIKGLKRICENGTGCAGCPVRGLCDAMDDLITAMNGAYTIDSVPGDWPMRMTEQIHEAMTKVLHEMDATPVEYEADWEQLKEV